MRVGPRATASGDDRDFAILRPFDVDRDASFTIEVTGDLFLELADGGGDLEDGIGSSSLSDSPISILALGVRLKTRL